VVPVGTVVEVVDVVLVVDDVLVVVVVGGVPRRGPDRKPPGPDRAAAAAMDADSVVVEGLCRKRFIELVQWVERVMPLAASAVVVRTTTIPVTASTAIR
jgi:hypothetical protein